MRHPGLVEFIEEAFVGSRTLADRRWEAPEADVVFLSFQSSRRRFAGVFAVILSMFSAPCWRDSSMIFLYLFDFFEEYRM